MFIFSGSLSYAEVSNYIDLYINPAASKLDWESPGGLAKSYMKTISQQKVVGAVTEITKSTVGHAVIGFHCNKTSGERVDLFTGMSGQETLDDSYNLVLKEKSGVKVLFKNYEDGYIETDEDARDLMVHSYGRVDKLEDGRKLKKDTKFLRFPVTAKQCDQAFDVYETFKDVSYEKVEASVRSLPDDQKVFYGLGLDAYDMYLQRKKDPKAKLGAICTSFAIAILKGAGVYVPDLDVFWKRHIEASADKIAEIDPATGKPYEFTVPQLFKEAGKHWVTPGLPTKSFDFYEPEKIWNFINDVSECQAKLTTCNPSVADWLSKQKYNFVPTKSEIISESTMPVMRQDSHGNFFVQDNVEYPKNHEFDGISF